jgi:acetylglutamate kinase
MAGDDNCSAAAKAAALVESLPWLIRLRGKIVVVKFGGNAMVDDELKRTFAEDMVFLREIGVGVIVVHGGGPQITAELSRRGIASEFRGGLRVTTPEALEVVREVLIQRVGAEIAALLQESHLNAAPDAGTPIAHAISGETDGLFRGRKRGTVVDGEAVDLGQVGDVVAVDPTAVLAMVEAGRIPVISSIAPDGDDPGHSLNVNADSAAAALAVAVGAERLVVLTDVAGLYSDWPNRDSLVSRIDTEELSRLLPSLESGMIPKMTACIDAVAGGVASASVIDGRLAHSILREAFTPDGSGTQVYSRAVPTPHKKAEK